MRDPNIQQRTHGYHGFLEAALGSERFVTSLNVYDEFINGYSEAVTKGDPNEEDYQDIQ